MAIDLFDSVATKVLEDRALEYLNDYAEEGRWFERNNAGARKTLPDLIEQPSRRTIDVQASYDYDKYGDIRFDVVSAAYPLVTNIAGWRSTNSDLKAALRAHINEYDPAGGVTGYLSDYLFDIRTDGKLYGAGEKRIDALLVLYFNGSEKDVDPATAVPARIQLVQNCARMRRLFDDRWPALVRQGHVQLNNKWDNRHEVGGSDHYWSMFVTYSADKLAQKGLAQELSVKRFADLTQLRLRTLQRQEAQRRAARDSGVVIELPGVVAERAVARSA